MSPEIIAVDYDKLADVAARFERMAVLSEALSRRMRMSSAQLLAEGWQGQGAAAFADEMAGEVLPALTRLTAMLNEGRLVTMAIGVRFSEGEEAAARLFYDDAVTSEGGQSGGGGGGGGVSTQDGWRITSTNNITIGPIGTTIRTADGSMYGKMSDSDLKFQTGFKNGKWEGIGFRYRGASGRLYGVGADISSSFAGIESNTVGKFEVGTGEAGADVKIGKKGLTAGPYYEAAAVQAETEQVLGSDQFALTSGVKAKLLSSEGFIGVKDNKFGAEIGVNIASVEGERGFNIFGYNISVKGEIGLKLELGGSIGPGGVEGKIPFFSGGISIGRAKSGKL